MDLDSYFGIHAKALSLRDARSSQIATNLTNADTPNYKAKDIDFNAALQNAMSPSQQMVTDNVRHINAHADFSTQTKYRNPQRHSLDGNTVDKDMETVEFAQNALGYQASLSFLQSKIRMMMSAFRGE